MDINPFISVDLENETQFYSTNLFISKSSKPLDG